MFKLFTYTTIFFAFSTAHAQQPLGLTSAKSIYENIERIATKREVPASVDVRRLVSIEPSRNLKNMADQHISTRGNVALILIDKDNIVYEGYSKDSNESHRFISMSMAKSLTSLAVGEALCSGKISSLDDAAEIYSSELKGLVRGRAKISDLLKMNSGVKTAQLNGHPYSTAGDDLLFGKVGALQLLRKFDNSDFQGIFGNTWNYSNLDTDALNYVIRGATGLSLGEWYAQTVAKKAGLEHKSFWALDVNKVEIAPSIYMATMRDWARIALYIRDAYKSPSKTCMDNYIIKATSKQVNIRVPEFGGYGYQFFLSNTTTLMNDFWMVGFAGQRIGFNLDADKIIINFSWVADPDKTYLLYRNWIRM
ncbi:MAG: beta-lactamase family protein [Acinetobacter sp.]|nr:beta-lactamase family protein [Acinetobacter sp.]